ncbi:hypothetical protein CEXT_233771 [Caerostris extrusa]|uniref:Uncharacterized protein n=1 Tax=Caerostris extrusa TaxID=172846 RepID=A0AAV4Y0Q7_CAEEX|nr:hypothetical protein CEXT_233771 [Caerostris extrusa]
MIIFISITLQMAEKGEIGDQSSNSIKLSRKSLFEIGESQPSAWPTSGLHFIGTANNVLGADVGVVNVFTPLDIERVKAQTFRSCFSSVKRLERRRRRRIYPSSHPLSIFRFKILVPRLPENGVFGHQCHLAPKPSNLIYESLLSKTLNSGIFRFSNTKRADKRRKKKKKKKRRKERRK